MSHFYSHLRTRGQVPHISFPSVQLHIDHKLTYFLPCAANSNPILVCFVCHSFQEITVVLSEPEVVVRAHVDDIVYRPPG